MKIADLLKLLNENKVHYIIIGAQACAAHGFVRATRDLDILIDPSPENIQRTRKALETFGYDTQDATVKDFQEKKILLRQYWLDTDIHPNTKGVDTQTALQNKIHGEYEGVPTYFVCLRDLILMKKAAGRSKDLEDLHHLKEIQRQKEKK